MLSYQHGFHAGNLADVHKHALLAVMLDHLTAKEKPLTYIETHAGRGVYDLSAPEALKTGEATEGIERAERARWFAKDHPYMRALTATRAIFGHRAYPGSPLIAATLLRDTDPIILAELHPQEQSVLKASLAPYRVDVRVEDGLKMALSITPPTPRRGMMLIDPSFEVKADYTTLPRLIGQVHAKWNVGVIALWYPILTDQRHRPMLAELTALALPKTLRSEVHFPPAREGHGMVGSGMFIVNAPFGLEDEAKRLSARFDGLGSATPPSRR